MNVRKSLLPRVKPNTWDTTATSATAHEQMSLVAWLEESKQLSLCASSIGNKWSGSDIVSCVSSPLWCSSVDSENRWFSGAIHTTVSESWLMCVTWWKCSRGNSWTFSCLSRRWWKLKRSPIMKEFRVSCGAVWYDSHKMKTILEDIGSLHSGGENYAQPFFAFWLVKVTIFTLQLVLDPVKVQTSTWWKGFYGTLRNLSG